jgi:sodium/hydrogen antiporter
MTSGALALIAAAVCAWGAFSARLERAHLTAPIVFVGVGVVLAGFSGSRATADAAGVMVLTDVTLVWVLFSDAARVGLREFRTDAGVYGRLLGLALPLTVPAGALCAWWILRAPVPWLALLVGAALAPTDAALRAVVIVHPAVPIRIRRLLNVESGLNDGIVTPVVLVALAAAASADAHGNGFVAAFAGGIAFGHVAGRGGPREVFYVEQTAGLASLLVWMLFGLIAVPLLFGRVDWRMLIYAMLSLTVVRMVPVALSLIGAHLDRRTVLFVGWFGPRGLASVIFALLTVEQLGPPADFAVAVIVVTVLLSVLAHGLTTGPLAVRYGDQASPDGSRAQEPAPAARRASSAPADAGTAVTGTRVGIRNDHAEGA